MSDGLARLRPRRHPRVWKPVWVPTKGVLKALSYGPLRMKVDGREHLPTHGPTLIVSNHVAFIDPLLVAVAALPRPVWTMGKEELFTPRVLEAWLSRIGGFPVRRQSPDVWAVRMGRDLLARGEALLIFPEGGVTRTGHMSPGFSGAGYFATRPDVQVIPAAIWDSQMLKGPVRIRFGEAIPMDDIRESPRAGRNRRAVERIMWHLSGMVPLVGGPYQDPPTGEPRIPLVGKAAKDALRREAEQGQQPAGDAPPRS
ncbi:MAG: 1-acyl-sn-glycerol-3-phosphate acyltransferase [Acidobacteria bacterium]|nr:1-acyl-sn-glycerol-3-phosphate acyltransferase [Acidobacteriota bacterium]